jgi:cell wall-associated NlpC family hydrolase
MVAQGVSPPSAARRSSSTLAALLSILVLAGCAQRGPAPEPPPAPLPPGATRPQADPLRNQIVFTALQMVGVPYRYGGTTPQGFDCSGLVQYAYRNAGLSVPRTSREQLAATSPVPLAEAEPGDLLFFRSDDWSHVGIYVGEGRFVHAPSTGRDVTVGNFADAWYRRNFVRAGRMKVLAARQGAETD